MGLALSMMLGMVFALVPKEMKASQEVQVSNSNIDQWTWCGDDLSDPRCCRVWGWNCAPEIEL